MAKIHKELGHAIRERRKAIGLTQAQLAEKTNLSDNFIGSIERGDRSPTIKTLARIASVLQVNVDSLFCPAPRGGKRKESINDLVRYLGNKDEHDVKLVLEIAKWVFEKFKPPTKKDRE